MGAMTMPETLQLNLRLTADGRDMVGEVRVARDELDRLGAGARQAGQQAGAANRQFRASGATMRVLTTDVLTLRNALAGLGIGLITRSLVKASLEMDRFRQTLRFSTGSVEAGADALRFLRGEADRLGVNFRELAGEYGKLAAAARGTALEGEQTREIFTAVAEASRVMGLSAADTGGILTAVQQIISKGTVSAEELRGQMGERLPGAFQAAARGMKVTTQELGQMLQRGEVLAEDLLPKLAAELRRSVAEALPDATQSAAAAFDRLDNALFDLKVTFGDELLPTIVELVNFLTQTGIPALTLALDRVGILKRDLSALTGGEAGVELERVRAQIRTLETGGRSRASGRAADELINRLREREASLQAIVNRAQADAIKQFGPGRLAEAAAATTSKTTIPADVLKGAEQLAEALREQIALFGQVGQAAEIRYQIEHGELRGLDPERQALLLSLADELDALEAAKQAAADKERVDRKAAGEAERSAKQAEQRAARERELLGERVEALRKTTLSAEQIERERHREALALLDQAQAQRIDAVADFHELRERLELVHERNLQEIREKANAAAIREQERLVEQQREVLEQPFRNAITGIQNAFTNAFERIFRGGVDSFRDFASTVKDIVIRMAAEIASLLVFRPILAGALSSVGASGLAASLGLASAGGTALSGGGLGGLTTGAGLASGLVRGFQSQGLANLGTGLGARLGLGAGAQAFLGNAGLNAPFGLLGGLGASLLGLSGGLPSLALGTAGSLAGGGLGASIGALGSFGGPIGAVAGGFLGSVLGGLFGGKPPRAIAGVQFDLASGVTERGGKGADPGQSEQIARSIAQSLEQLAQALGGTARGGFSVQTFGNADKFGKQPFGLNFGFQFASAEALAQAAPLELLRKGNVAITGLDAALSGVLKRSLATAKDLNQVIADVRDAREVLEVGPSRASSAVEALNRQFDELRRRARELGLAVQDVNAAHIEALRSLRDQGVSQFRALASQARSLLGLDALRSFRDSLATGPLSPFSPTAQLRRARAQLDQTARAALGGDLDAAREFPGQAQNVLQLGRSVFASGPQFADLFRSVNATLQSVIGKQEAIERSLGADVVLALENASADQIQAIREQTKALRAELAKVNSALRTRGVA